MSLAPASGAWASCAIAMGANPNLRPLCRAEPSPPSPRPNRTSERLPERSAGRNAAGEHNGLLMVLFHADQLCRLGSITIP